MKTIQKKVHEVNSKMVILYVGEGCTEGSGCNIGNECSDFGGSCSVGGTRTVGTNC